MRGDSAQSLAHSSHSHKYPPSLVHSGSEHVNLVFSKGTWFAVKEIRVPVSAVPVAGCVIFDRFLDLSELHCPHLQNKDDNAHLTRQRWQMKDDNAHKCLAQGLAFISK